MGEERALKTVGVAVSRPDEAPGYEPEEVRRLVRSAVLSSGLADAGSAAPLSGVVPRGSRVLLKPNWVLHANLAGRPLECTVTHPEVVEAVLEEVLRAGPAEVIIGDSPLQFCQLERLVPPSWRESLEESARAAGVRLRVVDFRRAIARGARDPQGEGDGIDGGVDFDVRGPERFLLFDLGADSLLEPVSTPPGRFRITHWAPERLNEAHQPGRHQYLLCREAFEADVVIGLPKLKTHHKVGMTATLKNLVGVNGNKDYLPHHRAGGSSSGGDCYPEGSGLKTLMEFCQDQAFRSINRIGYRPWRRAASAIDRLCRSGGDTIREGAWHGNDTAWRMALDLNRLLLYGRIDGTLSREKQREVYSLTDAIVAGQGEGPLSPSPLSLGVVTFAASSAYADLVHSSLLRFDWRRLPIVREAFSEGLYQIESGAPEDCRVVLDGEEVALEEMAESIGQRALAPAGWVGKVEEEGRSRRDPGR